MSPQTIPPVRPPRKRRGAPAHPPDPATLAGRVYVASSLSTHGTPRYGVKLAEVRGHFPKAAILPARDAFRSHVNWRRRWRDVLRTLSAVVVFDDGAGFIGAGTVREITEAAARGLPVYYLTPSGALLPCDDSGAVELIPRPWDPQRAAAIVYVLTLPEALAAAHADVAPCPTAEGDDARDAALLVAWLERARCRGRGVGDG